MLEDKSSINIATNLYVSAYLLFQILFYIIYLYVYLQVCATCVEAKGSQKSSYALELLCKYCSH